MYIKKKMRHCLSLPICNREQTNKDCSLRNTVSLLTIESCQKLDMVPTVHRGGHIITFITADSQSTKHPRAPPRMLLCVQVISSIHSFGSFSSSIHLYLLASNAPSNLIRTPNLKILRYKKVYW